LFAGGLSGQTFHTTIDIYTADTGNWTANNVCIARKRFSSVGVNNKILFSGGQGSSPPSNLTDQVDMYDTQFGILQIAVL